MEDSNASHSFSSSSVDEPITDLAGGGTFMKQQTLFKSGDTSIRLQRMPTYKFIVEPYVRFKFKKLKLDQVKQYRRMHRLIDTLKKRKNQVDSDDDDGNNAADDDQSDLDHDQLQEGVKVKLRQIKVIVLSNTYLGVVLHVS